MYLDTAILTYHRGEFASYCFVIEQKPSSVSIFIVVSMVAKSPSFQIQNIVCYKKSKVLYPSAKLESSTIIMLRLVWKVKLHSTTVNIEKTN